MAMCLPFRSGDGFRFLIDLKSLLDRLALMSNLHGWMKSTRRLLRELSCGKNRANLKRLPSQRSRAPLC